MARHNKPSAAYLICHSKRRGIDCNGVATPKLAAVEENAKKALREALKGLRLPERTSDRDPMVEARAMLDDAERRLGEGLADAIRLGLSSAEKDALLSSLRADVSSAGAELASASSRAAVSPDALRNVRRLATELVDTWTELNDVERREALAALDVRFHVGRKGVVTLTAPWRPAQVVAA